MSNSTVSSSPVSRRQRLHDETADEIKSVARGLMTTEGTSSLNLRAVARTLGMTPSALYRYYPSRDAILTALITDAYDAVGEAVEQAVERAPVDGTCTAMLAAVHAFRRWALEHPQEYGLIYGTPVPGYEAPPETTLPAAMRTSVVLLGLLTSALVQGLIRLPADEGIPADLREMFCEMAQHEAKAQVELPVAGWAVAMQFWVVLLGAINAEVFGHMSPILLGQSTQFFDFTMRRALAVMGVDQRSIDAGISPSY